jgi:hypothetical protein
VLVDQVITPARLNDESFTQARSDGKDDGQTLCILLGVKMFIIFCTLVKIVCRGQRIIDCANDDFLYEGNSLIHFAMRKKEIPHEFRTRDRGHNWTYWRASLPEILRFV